MQSDRKQKHTRPLSSRRARTIATTAIAVTGAYLTYRLTTLGSGWLLFLSIPLLLAELAAFVQLVLLAFQAWSTRELPPPGPSGPNQRVDLIIDGSHADAAMIERTLVGASTVTSRGATRVIDSVARLDIADLVATFGADYIVDDEAPAGRASTLHRHANTEIYAWLEGGQVPMPDLIAGLSPRFDDDSVAVCQAAIGLLNEDSLVHIQRGRDEEALQREVLAPGLDRHGTAPWHGSASLIRRSAIDSIGGFTEDGDADVQRTLVRLHAAGWKSRFDPDPLVRAIAPDTLDDYLLDRRRRIIETLRVYRTTENPVRFEGLDLKQRLSHVATASMFGAGIRQLVVVCVLMGTLLTGRVPFDAELVPIVSLWLLAMGLGAIARRQLARGSMKIGDWTRQGWRTLGADLAGLAAVFDLVSTDERTVVRVHSGWRSLGRLRVLTVVVVALDLALLIRAGTLVDGSLLPAFTTEERVVVLAFGLLTLVPMVDVLQLYVSRRQRRRTFRLQARLDVELGDTKARTVDLATTGVGVLMGFAPELGTVTPVRLELPDVDGTIRSIRGSAVVRATSTDRTGLIRVGLEFANLADEARLALIEYCIVGHAAQEARRAAESAIAEPHVLTIGRSQRDHLSTRALTGAASLAGVVTLFAGPAVAGADVLVLNEVEKVCVAGSDGSPVVGAQIDARSSAGWETAGTTSGNGCVDISTIADTTGLAAVHEAIRMEATPQLDVDDGTLTFRLQQHAIRLLSTEGTGVNGAPVRYFTDRWHDAGPTNSAGVAAFETLSDAIEFEVSWKGSRFVRPLVAGGVDVVLGRVDSGGADVAEINRGNGWEPFFDRIQVMPGPVALRLADGSAVKVTVESGHAYDVLSGTQTAVAVAPTPRVAADDGLPLEDIETDNGGEGEVTDDDNPEPDNVSEETEQDDDEAGGEVRDDKSADDTTSNSPAEGEIEETKTTEPGTEGNGEAQE